MTTAPPYSTSGPAWRAAPRELDLAEGTLDVWRVDLEEVSDAWLDALSPDERERAERILSDRDGRVWALARGVLRALLGGYLRRHPASLGFGLTAQGKPTVTVPQSRLSFNLSHSAALAIYAFSAAGPVGVDVELARKSVNELAISERVLGPQHAHRLRGLERSERESEFLRIWTRHEAEAKCIGTGLSEAPAAGTSNLWIAELDVGSRGAAAVAMERPPRDVRAWQWSGPPGLSSRACATQIGSRGQ